MRTMKKFLLIAFLLLQSTATGAAPARDTLARNGPSTAPQDHAQIRNAVADCVQQQTATLPGKATFQVDEIDRRIVLPKCNRLEAFLPTASQATESSQPGGFTDPRQVLGKVLRYGIAAGQVLREDMLRQPYSVTQGQIVQLAVQGSGFSIRSEGVALNNASEGQAVQVRVGSSRVISGVARAGGVVEIVP